MACGQFCSIPSANTFIINNSCAHRLRPIIQLSRGHDIIMLQPFQMFHDTYRVGVGQNPVDITCVSKINLIMRTACEVAAQDSHFRQFCLFS
jgi:hypothetical protein